MFSLIAKVQVTPLQNPLFSSNKGVCVELHAINI